VTLGPMRLKIEWTAAPAYLYESHCRTSAVPGRGP
jgi:hypothetical protein